MSKMNELDFQDFLAEGLVINEVLQERMKAILKGGYTPKKDDGYVDMELRRAAIFLLTTNDVYLPFSMEHMREKWLSKSYRHRLIMAMGFILSEVGRIDRETTRLKHEADIAADQGTPPAGLPGEST